jgi:amidase
MNLLAHVPPIDVEMLKRIQELEPIEKPAEAEACVDEDGCAPSVCAWLTGFDLGSDTGGSIRIPTHFCGLFARKPTWGLVPLRGHALTEMAADIDLGTFGPIARSANDLALVMSLLYNPDPDDSDLHQTLPPPAASLGGLRVAVLGQRPRPYTESETIVNRSSDH